MMTVCHPHLPILSIWVLVLLNGINCQDNEGACQDGTQCKTTVHSYLEDTARKVLQNDILPELESRFNGQLEAQAKVISFKIKEIGWLLNSLACLKHSNVLEKDEKYYYFFFYAFTDF